MKVFDLGQIKNRENLSDPRAVWRKRGKTRLLQSNDFFSHRLDSGQRICKCTALNFLAVSACSYKERRTLDYQRRKNNVYAAFF